MGSLTASVLGDRGQRVVAYDRAKPAVARYRAAAPAGVVTTTDPMALDECNVIVVAVRIDPEEGEMDSLNSVGALLCRLVRTPRLIMVATTVPVGATRTFARRWLDDSVTFVAYTPERARVGDAPQDVREVPHLVGGVDAASTEVALSAMRVLCDQPVPVTSPEVCELAKLLENSFRAVGIALIAEISQIAHANGISAAEVASAAATKPFGYYAFHPGPGIGGHCLPNDLALLRASATASAVSAPLLEGAAEVIQSMPRLTVDTLETRLQREGVALAGADVLLVGTGFKIGSSDQTNSPAVALVQELRRRKARPQFADTRNGVFQVDGEPVPSATRRLLDSSTHFDAALIVAGDESIAPDAITRVAEVVLDLGGGRIMSGSEGRFEQL